MRITIVSRIYSPEPAAATPTLSAIAQRFANAKHDVAVMTSRVPRELTPIDERGVRIRRAPVLRDRQGYVRGYLPYLSFDLPLFFRLVASRRPDVYVVEPPPTTIAVVRLVAWMKRRPYVVRAADIWSDAAAMTTKSRVALRLLRAAERFALRGAAHLFAVSPEVLTRARELGADGPATVVGWGVDTTIFHNGPQSSPNERPYFIYAGTHSEWHGAGIFVKAFASFSRQHPGFRLIFVGNGSEREHLKALTEDLGLDSVEFRPAIAASELRPLLTGAVAALASLLPGGGYEYAFTTKIFASLACGCPTVFSGVGPTRVFIDRTSKEVRSGEEVDYDVDAVAAAMARAAEDPPTAQEREATAEWARERFSFDAVADAFYQETSRIVEVRRARRG
jgi:glycosyltransferase involved in cell wall biosynthesis